MGYDMNEIKKNIYIYIHSMRNNVKKIEKKIME